MWITPKALSNWSPHLRLTWQKNSGKQSQQPASLSLDVAGQHGDESKLIEDEIEIVVQIKGKVRAKLMVAKTLSREELYEVALAVEKVKARDWLQEIRRWLVSLISLLILLWE